MERIESIESAAYIYGRFVFSHDQIMREDVQFYASDFPQDRLLSILTFIRRLGRVEVIRALHRVIDKKYDDEERSWKYFCGICWKRLKAVELSY